MKPAAGQTLVLFALTLLLLSLLVMMTIGIGMRIHERQEQQTVADAAAYSEAVAGARTFNAVAVENRVLVAQMASIAASQSLLSWLGFYHGNLNQARDVLADMSTRGGCSGAAVTLAHQRVMAEDERLIHIWEPPGAGYSGVNGHDSIAGNYIRRDLYATALMIAEDQKAIYAQMRSQVGDASETIVKAAREGSPWRNQPGELRSGPQTVTRAELKLAVIEQQREPMDQVRATMAARGVDPFVSARESNPRTGDLSGATYIQKRIAVLVAPLQIRVTNYGTSYFGDSGPQVSSGPAEAEGYDGQKLNRPEWRRWTRLKTHESLPIIGAWAQDYGTFHFEPPPGCSATDPTEQSFGYIVTTGPGDDRDNHMWQRGNRGFGDYRERRDELNHVTEPYWPDKRHSFLEVPDGTVAPNIWPVFVDFNADTLGDATSRTDAYGQPKTLSNVTRRYEARGDGDPWDLRLRFSFNQSGPGQLLDLRGRRPGLSHAVAMAAGLIYYHRGQPARPGPGGVRADHSREPPNFLNPFWRASLVASDVDEGRRVRGRDVEATLRAIGEPEQAEALRLLRTSRFEAMP